MIAVVGRLDSGPAAEIARRSTGRGAATELVAKVREGPEGDRRLLELAAANVGHAATLRSGTATLEPADVQLALRYLPDLRVVVVASDAATLVATAAEAATWSGAALVVVAQADLEIDLSRAIVLEGPADDPDGAFAGLVAALAVRLDAGEDPAGAWRHVSADLSVDEVSPPAARGPADRDPARGPGRPG